MRSIVVALLVLLAATSAVEAITVAEYRAELRFLDAELRRGDSRAARVRAMRLKNETVHWDGESLVPDGVLLSAVSEADTPDEMRRSRRLVAATLSALAADVDDETAVSTDPSMLEKLRQTEATTRLEAGGEVASVPSLDETMAEKTAHWIAAAWEWAIERLDRLFDWILELWPRRPDGSWSIGSATNLVVAILVAAILLLIGLVAFRVLRRKAPDAALQPVTRSTAHRRLDDDPLSREANEWERYALELTAAGRIRDAIRAWYHAVLVSLYRAGIVHYRRGRTNWEYVSALGPELAWRPRFVEMTRTFEREWYGHSESSRDALDRCAVDAQAILAAVERKGAA